MLHRLTRYLYKEGFLTTKKHPSSPSAGEYAVTGEKTRNF